MSRLTYEDRIREAQRKAEVSAEIAQETADEILGAEDVGLSADRLETLRDRQRRHEERAAVWSATARKLREQQAAGKRPEGWTPADERIRQRQEIWWRDDMGYRWRCEDEAQAEDLERFPRCRFCGLPESDCAGEDIELDIPAHDYAPGGIPREHVEGVA